MHNYFFPDGLVQPNIVLRKPYRYKLCMQQSIRIYIFLWQIPQSDVEQFISYFYSLMNLSVLPSGQNQAYRNTGIQLIYAHLSCTQQGMKKYVDVSKNKLNMMRSKPLSMKQRFGKKKIKFLYCRIWPSVSFYTKKSKTSQVF